MHYIMELRIARTWKRAPDLDGGGHLTLRGVWYAVPVLVLFSSRRMQRQDLPWEAVRVEIPQTTVPLFGPFLNNKRETERGICGSTARMAVQESQR